MAEKIFPAGVDPTDPALIKRMKEEAARVKAENAPPRCMIEGSDLVDEMIIAGMPCRPMSAGVFAVLEMIDSPFLKGKEGEEELKFDELIDPLFLMLSDREPAEFVELAQAGAKMFHAEAVAWAFAIDMRVMAEMQRDFGKLMNSFQQTMDLYAAGDGDKKK